MPRVSHATTALLVLLVLSCGGGKKLPAQHPVGELSNRASARLEFIAFIIPEKERAKKVVRLHEELVALAPEFNRVRGKQLQIAMADLEENPASLKPAALKVRDAEVIMFERYRTLMLELRTIVSEKEYRRLQAIR